MLIMHMMHLVCIQMGQRNILQCPMEARIWAPQLLLPTRTSWHPSPYILGCHQSHDVHRLVYFGLFCSLSAISKFLVLGVGSVSLLDPAQTLLWDPSPRKRFSTRMTSQVRKPHNFKWFDFYLVSIPIVYILVLLYQICLSGRSEIGTKSFKTS